MRFSFTLSILAAAGLIVMAHAQAPKKPLTHDVYDSWKSLSGIDLSRDGKFLTFAINPQSGDGELTIREIGNSKETKIARGSAARYTADSKFLLATIVPPKAEVDKARKEKKAPKDQPKNSLTVVNLASGSQSTIERVKTWRLPAKDSGWFAYQLEEPPTPPAPPKSDAPAKPPTDGVDQGSPQAQPQKPEEPKKDEPKKKKEHAVGSEWILRRISDGKEIKLADVGELVFNDAGNAVLYSVSTKTGDKDGLYWLDLQSEKTTAIAVGMGQYKQLAIHKGTGTVAFSTDRDQYAKEPTEWSIHVWAPGDKSSRKLVGNETPGILAGWALPGRGSLSFSHSGKRLFFGTAPKAEPEPKTESDEEKPNVDVWSWTDKVLMPVQLLQATSQRNRTFDAVIELNGSEAVQLEGEETGSVQVGNRRDGEFGISVDGNPYQMASSWTEAPADVYIVDVKSGKRTIRFKEFRDSMLLAPSGKSAVYFDGERKQWYSVNLRTGIELEISAGVPVPLWDTEDDHPVRPGPAGFPVFTDDGRMVVSDSRDLWVLDVDGKGKAYCLTEGIGRLRNWTFSIQSFPREDDIVGIATDGPILLKVVDRGSYASGFFRDSFRPNQPAEMLMMGDYSVDVATKAEDANTLAIRRQTFVEYPEVWLTNLSFESPRKVTETNPQQKEYLWGKSELVNWISADGVPLKGVLIKPENFDPAKKYPMIVYFYEVSSNEVHTHRVPSPSASTINPTMFASNGYLVFMPDIPYTIGYPGESAEKAIISGTLEVLRRGYVDSKRIGIQGQSWGGYQVMHLITRTKLYAAAGAGAAVSNMTSAYGGIRLGSGLVRQFQYEVGQSRIGGSIWDTPLRYLENSPLFWADKVETPVLMMNNDADDAVPFQQGVEMFTALRRLGKRAWMLNYVGDKHNLTNRANRKDLSIRMHQFFDHYLKGAPMPKWMAEGLPAVKKGRDPGYELVKTGSGN